MVSDSDLLTRLREILQNSDLNTATAGSVRRKLEEDFSVDLSDRKAFIREQIDTYLETLDNNNEEEDSKDRQIENEEGDENDAVDVSGEEEKEEESEGHKRLKKKEKEGRKRGGGGFTKLCSLSPQLQKLLGVSELGRTEVVKRLWVYIREKDLQDPKNRRNIKCDEVLQEIFRVKSINMFQMNKVLSKHIWPLEAENEKLKAKDEEGDDSVSKGSNHSGKEEDGEEEEEEKEKEDAEGSNNTEEEEEGSDNPAKEEEEEEEDEEEIVEKKDNKKNKKGSRGNKVDKEVKKKGGGFAKLCCLSPQLQEFTGETELARTEVVKRLWCYIRENNLQDPKNRRNILCDESLHSIFRVDSINMFQMNKVLSKHIWPLEDAPDKSLLKEKRTKQQREEDSDDTKHKEKRQKKGASGLLAPLPLSDALIKFIGTGENELSRQDVVKRMWGYIKQNELQDPSDKRRILCDDKLKELFEVDSFNGFSVSKLLTSHFIKMEG